MSIGPFILLLPDIALETIFSFLSFDEIARNRVICKKFNDVGGNLLSRGFMQIEKKHATIYKRVKSMLPRRESERRIHPLFRHCDILSAVETRISMLNMTYMKYIQSSMCCFIPGKVLDELERVLVTVEKPGIPPRTHELLQELRDISSMAMEYFDEKILPSIKGHANTLVPYSSSTSSATHKAPRVYFVPPGLSDEMRKVLKNNKKQKAQITCLTRVVQKLYTKIQKQNHTIKTQARKLQEHENSIQEQTTKLHEHETTINDLKKHMDEWDQKFSDLTAEVNRSRDDMAKTILPKLPDVRASCTSAPKTFTRPRLSQVQAPNSYLMELERKRKSSIEFEIPHKFRMIAPRESTALQLKEKLNNKMNENITKNISKNLRTDDDTSRKKQDFTKFFYDSVEALLKNPISSIQSRKRRLTEELDLN